ncbi:AAA family ATPase [Streptomyces sp. KS 21]|uniref:AAA family ATPase n=1 Tax=Streptomyces sp. KS 21 TaxID=2485150 RepID=UPI0010645792|nr:AAA family ATPase [Streptomyces sp. KS 21]TDU80424.1 tetratricopeptide repeat protein [Streptomyces sp. KS 21]
MSDESPLIRSLRAAVAAAPEDVPLRLHFTELLLAEGRHDEAVTQAAVALQHAPGDEAVRDLMVRAMQLPTVGTPPPAATETPAPPTTTPPQAAASAAPSPATGGTQPRAFDWAAAEQEVADVVGPRFAADPTGPTDPIDPTDPADTGDATEAPLTADGSGDPADASAWDIDAPGDVRLADVGGMQQVKDRLEAAFLAPMRNPELRKLYGKSLRGGLLLYGPPGCGKTFIARAVAGELGAGFMSVSLSDILDMYIGTSEKNVHDIFEAARRQAPCVIFLDELDALGAKRSRMHHSGLRNVVNQLLTELDGINAAQNEGVFVLAATNVPWDVDLALRRPGRLDRTLLVLPPDAPARESILRYHLRERPIESVDLGKIVKVTEDFSGADLAHLCESAAEYALLDSARSGTIRMIGTKDLLTAAKQIKPSSESWFASARNVAMFANDGGVYDDLVTYLKKKRKL